MTKPTRLMCRMLALLLAVASARGQVLYEQTMLIDGNGDSSQYLGGQASWASTDGLALSGSLLVVGAPLAEVQGLDEAGTVSVFRRVDGCWVEEAELVAGTPEAGARFGAGVGVSGDVIFVGAPRRLDDQGSVTIFRHDGSAWADQGELFSPLAQSNAWFGESVSVDGDLALVAAPSANVLHTNAGSVLAYRQVGQQWVPETLLTSSQEDHFLHFGTSVSMRDGLAVVGANGPSAKLASVFRHGSSGWVEEAVLVPAVLPAGSGFGRSVDVHGDLVVVGDDSAAGGGVAASGAATVFRRVAGQWIEEATLGNGQPDAFDHFGCGVSVDGDQIVVGAFDDGDGGLPPGSATVFRHENGAWVELTRLQSSWTTREFGAQTKLRDGVIGVLAPRHKVDGDFNRGALFLFELEPTWTPQFSALYGTTDTGPALSASGTLESGSLNCVQLFSARASALAALFVSFAESALPFKGGVLKAFSPLNPPLLTSTDAQGHIQIVGHMLGGVPAGTELWWQWAVVDPQAVQGVALSNALLGVTP